MCIRDRLGDVNVDRGGGVDAAHRDQDLPKRLGRYRAQAVRGESHAHTGICAPRAGQALDRPCNEVRRGGKAPLSLVRGAASKPLAAYNTERSVMPMPAGCAAPSRSSASSTGLGVGS